MSELEQSKKPPVVGDPNNSIHYELCVAPRKGDSNTLAQITALEGRIQQLETLLGTQNAGFLVSLTLTCCLQKILINNIQYPHFLLFSNVNKKPY